MLCTVISFAFAYQLSDFPLKGGLIHAELLLKIFCRIKAHNEDALDKLGKLKGSDFVLEINQEIMGNSDDTVLDNASDKFGKPKGCDKVLEKS